MPGSILAAGPVSVLESLEVSAVSCQRASAVWRIKSPACLYFSRPLLPWKQVPQISHFFIFLYTIHITPPTTTSTFHAAAALLLPPPTTCRIVQSHTIPVYCSHFTMSKNTSFSYTHSFAYTNKSDNVYGWRIKPILNVRQKSHPFCNNLCSGRNEKSLLMGRMRRQRVKQCYTLPLVKTRTSASLKPFLLSN